MILPYCMQCFKNRLAEGIALKIKVNKPPRTKRQLEERVSRCLNDEPPISVRMRADPAIQPYHLCK